MQYYEPGFGETEDTCSMHTDTDDRRRLPTVLRIPQTENAEPNQPIRLSIVRDEKNHHQEENKPFSLSASEFTNLLDQLALPEKILSDAVKVSLLRSLRV